MANLLDITDENFEQEVAQAEVPVLIDFWAPWCVPCKRIAPIVEQLAQELEGRAKVVKCDIDQARGVAGRFGVFSIPTLLLLVRGEVKEQIVGVTTKEAILSKMEPHLA